MSKDNAWCSTCLYKHLDDYFSYPCRECGRDFLNYEEDKSNATIHDGAAEANKLHQPDSGQNSTAPVSTVGTRVQVLRIRRPHNSRRNVGQMVQRVARVTTVSPGYIMQSTLFKRVR